MEDRVSLTRTDNDEEEMETDYLKQDVSISGDSLNSSKDSSMGSVSIPSFGMDRSFQLQASQGFQVVNAQGGQNSLGNATYMIPVIKSEAGSTLQTFISTQQLAGNYPLMQNVQLTGNSDVFVNKGDNQLSGAFIVPNPLNISESASGFGPKLEPVATGISSTTYAVDSLSNMNQSGLMVTESTAVSGRTDRQTEPSSSSSDEKSNGKCKTSPKPVVRKKSRSTSSLGAEGSVTTERSPSRTGEMGEAMHFGEMGFKPSLLEEILAEKKRALMKTPEMIQFLQAQQERLSRTRQVSRDSDDSMNDAVSTSAVGETG